MMVSGTQPMMDSAAVIHDPERERETMSYALGAGEQIVATPPSALWDARWRRLEALYYARGWSRMNGAATMISAWVRGHLTRSAYLGENES